MYTHFLVPTDGSPLAVKGVKAAVRLARVLGAKVTAVYVLPRDPPPVYGADGAVFVPEVPAGQFRRDMKGEAAKALGVVEDLARGAGVTCTSATPMSNAPWQAIVRTAQARKCDLVVMASHGRSGLSGLLLAARPRACSRTPASRCSSCVSPDKRVA